MRPRSGNAKDFFRCDCRGVGTDWNVEELRKISTALLGTVDIVPDPAGLAADFEAMMQASTSRCGSGPHSMPRSGSSKQVAPTGEDLTDRRA